jgi:UDP-2,3-diacylglucosamine pyrophosphatase LpxH
LASSISERKQFGLKGRMQIMSIQDRTKEVLARMNITPTLPENSLQDFYKVRDSKAVVGKQVLKYIFDEEVFQEYGLNLIPITDVHLGARHSNVAYFQAFVDLILATPNAVTILNGDLAETATKVSVGAAMFEEVMNIPEQLETLVAILKPLAEAGKILGVGPGNHEERVANLIGINPMQILADKLNVPYFGYQGFFKVVVKDIPYKIAFHHGTGGGSTNGSKTNSAERMNKVVLADLYVSGHTHGRQTHQDLIYTFDDETDTVMPWMRTYVVAGSFMEYFGGYSEMKALAPSITGAVSIQLSSVKKDIRVYL